MEEHIRKTIMNLLFRSDIVYDLNKNEINDIDLASLKAYPDMASHTLHLKNPKMKEALKDEGCRVIREGIRSEFKSILNQEEFDKWHRSVCKRLIQTYCNNTKGSDSITFGQAQKWLNMTIKYYYIICELNGWSDDADVPFFHFAHIPIDSIMYDVIEEKLGIKKPSKAWSKWDDYDEYLEYQKLIRDRVPDLEDYYDKKWPLAWEMTTWVPR